MGCNSSKRVDADVFRPAPASFAIFDINSIQEPWIVLETTTPHDQKPTHVPAQILEKLHTFESDPAPPNSWIEVSKVLEDLKPKQAIEKPTTLAPEPDLLPTKSPEKIMKPNNKLRTVEELDAKLSAPKPNPIINSTPLPPKIHSSLASKSLKDNMFIAMDRAEREKEGKLASYEKMMKMKRDPLGDFPEKCPPGGENEVVLYTTSVRGVRKTYENCTKVRNILELHRVVFDERDVSLHSGFLSELKELLGDENSSNEVVAVPQLFIKGRHLGGADRVVDLNETGRLGRMLTWAGVERGVGRLACLGCGGARFVPCGDCGGSCKVVVVVEGKAVGDKEKCPKCNENGLVLCPACL